MGATVAKQGARGTGTEGRLDGPVAGPVGEEVDPGEAGRAEPLSAFCLFSLVSCSFSCFRVYCCDCLFSRAAWQFRQPRDLCHLP